MAGLPGGLKGVPALRCGRSRLQGASPSPPVKLPMAKQLPLCLSSSSRPRNGSTLTLDSLDSLDWPQADDWGLRSVMGSTARAPRWAIAGKFSATQGTTRLSDIQVSVGRSGQLTPVALLEPLNLGGVVIQRASLHNIDIVSSLDLRIGDLVTVQRSGDVIPQVVGRSLEAAEGDKTVPRSEPWSMPDSCPSCGARVVCERDERTLQEEGQVPAGHAGGIVRCPGGLTCPAQAVERLCHFVGRQALDIKGLGQRKIQVCWAPLMLNCDRDHTLILFAGFRSFTRLAW